MNQCNYEIKKPSDEDVYDEDSKIEKQNTFFAYKIKNTIDEEFEIEKKIKYLECELKESRHSLKERNTNIEGLKRKLEIQNKVIQELKNQNKQKDETLDNRVS